MAQYLLSGQLPIEIQWQSYFSEFCSSEKYGRLCSHISFALKTTITYINALFAPELETCQSVTGFLVQHLGNTIAWGTKRQYIVTTSSTTAKYVAIADTLSELALIQHLDSEILHLSHPIEIMEDNISTKIIAETG